MEKYLKFEYFYIVLILAWRPFQRFILRADGSGRFILFLTVVFVLILINKKIFYQLLKSKPLLIWGVWVVYAFTNGLIQGYSYDIPNYSFFMYLFLPYFMMMIINLLAIRNYDKLINVLIFGMYLSLILILILNDGDGIDGRFGGGINANTTGIWSTVLLMFIYLKYAQGNKSIGFLVGMSILPITSIIISGSKTAFGGFLLLILAHFIVNRSKYFFSNLIKLAFIFIFLSLPLIYLLNNSKLGERILTATKESEELEIDTGNTFLNKFGDRGIFYYTGWQVFKEHPIFGVGLGNYVFYNEKELVQHSEYMIQLSELGVIGFSLFTLFYFSVFKRIKINETNSNSKKNYEICLAFVFIILVMISATRMFKSPHLFAVIGVVLGYISKEKKAKKLFFFVKKKEVKKFI